MADFIKVEDFGIDNPESTTILYEAGSAAVHYDGLHGICNDLRGKGVSAQILEEVLRMICETTLLFRKPFEYLTNQRISEGNKALRQRGVRCSIRQVIRARHVLEDAGLIYHIHKKEPGKKNQGGINAYYTGVNVKALVDHMRQEAECYGSLDEEDHPEISKKTQISQFRQKVKTLLQDEQAIQFLTRFMESFSGMVVKSFEEVKDKVAEIKEATMSSLRFAADAAKGRIEERRAAKEKKKAESPMYGRNGSPNPAAFIAVWNRVVQDSDLYPEYVSFSTATQTGKAWNSVNAMAKKFLKNFEPADGGAVEDYLSGIIQKWDDIARGKDTQWVHFEIDGEQKHSKVPNIPDLRHFLLNRAHYDRSVAVLGGQVGESIYAGLFEANEDDVEYFD